MRYVPPKHQFLQSNITLHPRIRHSSFRFKFGKPGGTRPCGTPRSRYGNIIKISILEIKRKIHGRGQWEGFCKHEMKLRHPENLTEPCGCIILLKDSQYHELANLLQYYVSK
jgi:hypothetical protein